MKLLGPPQVTQLGGPAALEPQLVLTAVRVMRRTKKAAVLEWVAVD